MIKAYLKESITWERMTGHNARNEPAYAAAATLAAKIDWKQQRIQNLQGEEIIAIGPVYVEYNADIGHNDKITISGDTYAIVFIAHPADFSRRFTQLWIK